MSSVLRLLVIFPQVKALMKLKQPISHPSFKFFEEFNFY